MSPQFLVTLGVAYNNTAIKDSTLAVGICAQCTVTDPTRVISGSTRALEYEQWTTAGTRALLASPVYRIAFMLVTPARLMRSLQSRWELMRRGTELLLEQGDASSCLLRIKHPLALYSDLHRRTRAATVRTVIECAGGKLVTARVTNVTLLSWQVLCKWES